MNSLILITHSENSVWRFASIAESKWRVNDACDNHCVIESDLGHAIINTDQSIRNDYEKDELAKVLNAIQNPKFFIFEFNNFEFGKEVLMALTDADDIVVDDDHGNVITGREFSSKIKHDVCFDWR